MKFIIKGDFEILRKFSVVQGVYTYLEYGISALQQRPFTDDKREIEFIGKGPLTGHNLKIIENQKTKTLTAIVK